MKKILLILLTILFISCDKDPIVPDRPNKTLVSVRFESVGLIKTQMKSTYTIDINEWVYNYNTIPAVFSLQETTTGKLYTATKTIDELKAGFTMRVEVGTYRATYTSIPDTTSHTSRFLDVKVDEIVNIDGSGVVQINPKALEYLVIADFESRRVYFHNNASWDLIAGPDKDNNGYPDYRYGYIDYLTNPLRLIYLFPETTDLGSWIDIPNVSYGNVYHIIRLGGTNITFNAVPMVYNKIVLDN